MITENVPTTNHSQSAADTYDSIFAVLMTQMEQLRPHVKRLRVQNAGAKKMVCKMITSIKELLDDLMELQTQ